MDYFKLNDCEKKELYDRAKAIFKTEKGLKDFEKYLKDCLTHLKSEGKK